MVELQEVKQWLNKSMREISSMKEILAIVGKIMAIFGFAAVVWKMGAYFEKKNAKALSVEQVVNVIQQEFKDYKETSMAQYTTLKEKQDSLRDEFRIVVSNQSYFNNRYVIHLQNDAKWEEAIEFLRGLKPVIIAPPKVVPDTSITAITRHGYNKQGKSVPIQTITSYWVGGKKVKADTINHKID